MSDVGLAWLDACRVDPETLGRLQALFTLYDAPVCVTETAATVCWSIPATLAEEVGAASAVPVPETMTPPVLVAVVAPEAFEPEEPDPEEELAATPLETILMLCHVPD